jgi:1-acyl-sn-glycerol-3-phosphate acyltransferase
VIAVGSFVRILLGFLFVAIVSVLAVVVLVVLLPSRRLRVLASSLWAKAVGSVCLGLSGIALEIVGREHLAAAGPAVYVSNHTSLLDVLIAMAICPLGTTAVAKKETAFVPLVGLVYLLSGSLLVDRSARDQAIAALQKQARFVRRARLSLVIWPEGTRSRTGRLLPFKKGFVHLALQTGLPVVPIVVSGAYRAWNPGTFRIADGARVRVQILAPVPTDRWSQATVAEHAAAIERAFRDRLAAEMQEGA